MLNSVGVDDQCVVVSTKPIKSEEQMCFLAEKT